MADPNTGRPNHIEDALINIHPGQWFEWTDNRNKIYSNLKLTEKIGVDGDIVDNPITTLPTEAKINAKLVEVQESWDLDNNSYLSERSDAYPLIEEQLAMIYDDIESGKLNKRGSFYKALKAIKTKYSNPNK
mgnify:CR=1 FL=1